MRTLEKTQHLKNKRQYPHLDTTFCFFRLEQGITHEIMTISIKEKRRKKLLYIINQLNNL